MWGWVEADADAALIGEIFYHFGLQAIGIIMGLVAGAGLSIVAYRFGSELRTHPDFTLASRTIRQLPHMIEVVGKKDSHDDQSKPGEDPALDPTGQETPHMFDNLLATGHEGSSEETRRNEREHIDA